MMLKKRLHKKSFKGALWAEQRDDRKYMVSSLESANLLIGLGKREVLEMLGDEFNDINSDVWSYYIGTKTFFSYKIFLYIYFNTEGKVFKTVKN